MLNFVICDDNKIILERLTKMLESIFISKSLSAQVSFYTTQPDELLSYIKNNTVDVLILDIDLKSDYTGLDLAKLIRKNNKNMYLIFLTAHLEYALIAYKLKTFDYISKPVVEERLDETVSRIFDDISNSNTNKFIQIANSKILVKEDDIQFIQKDGMKIIYHTSVKNYEAYSSFSKISDSLPSNFIRCHKSYIVNVNNIKNIESNEKIFFDKNLSCSIGPKYKNNLMEVFNDGNFTKCF